MPTSGLNNDKSDLRDSDANPVVLLASADLEVRSMLQPHVKGQQQQQRRWCSSRSRWLIVITGLLVVAVVAIGAAVGVTMPRSGERVARTESQAPAAQAETDSVVQLPNPEEFDASLWEGVVADYYQQLSQSSNLTPDTINSFIAEARTLLQSKFNITLPQYLGSPKTILQYLQATRQWPIIQKMAERAEGRNLSSIAWADLVALANQLETVFDAKSLSQFNKGQSIAHEYVVSKLQAEGEELTLQQLVDLFSAEGYDMSEEELIANPERDATNARRGTRSPSPRSPPGSRSSRRASPSPARKKRAFTFPSLRIPLVFHFMQYPEVSKGKRVAMPPTWDAQAAADTIVKEVNNIFKAYIPSIQFRIGEVRRDSNKHKYLLVSSLQEWQALAADGLISGPRNTNWVSQRNAPVDQYINVWVASSFSTPQAPCQNPSGTMECGRGYAWVTPIVSCAATEQQRWQHVFIMYDEASPGLYNKDWGGYNPGAIVLAHELGHHLGLEHTHSGLKTFPYGCSKPNDKVADTPENDDAMKQEWWEEADAVCSDYLNGVSINWGKVLRKFDSCPKSPGTDAIFNVMSYTPDSCRNARHLGFTPGQTTYMKLMTAQCRKKLVACASGRDKSCYK